MIYLFCVVPPLQIVLQVIITVWFSTRFHVFGYLFYLFELLPFMKQLNRFTKLQSRALQLQPVLRTIMMLSHRIPMSHAHLV